MQSALVVVADVLRQGATQRGLCGEGDAAHQLRTHQVRGAATCGVGLRLLVRRGDRSTQRGSAFCDFDDDALLLVGPISAEVGARGLSRQSSGNQPKNCQLALSI